ncbi:MAG: hypothetical protein BEN18_11385 [Epulopiscium sp. Nuni2H_MBin001]|nr:MAG: hypothetical protein BEN18_11385 [Epulopiscium sp. Nuni2H_MBin001]
MFDFISDFFGVIFNVIFNGVEILTPIGTLGFAIILFTLVSRLLMTPLQIKQQRTTRTMGKLQPELQKIQKKYAGKKDQASQLQQSQEMQALYKKYNINPLAGCLPLLIQLPLIYAVYAVLRQPSRHIEKLAELYAQIAIKIEAALSNSAQVINELLIEHPFSSTAQLEIDKLGDSVVLANQLANFTTKQWEYLLEKAPELNQILEVLMQQKIDYEYFFFNLVDSPSQLVSGGNYFALVVPILAGASTFIFSKLTMAQSAPPASSNSENPAESMMKTMNIIMPIMMGSISYTVSTGLALYWIAGNLIMMGQQAWIAKVVKKQEAVIDEKLRLEREALAKTSKKKKKKKKPIDNKQADDNNKPVKERKERKQPDKD